MKFFSTGLILSQCVLAHIPFAKIVEMAVDNHMNKKVTNIVPFATLLCRLYDDLFSL